LEEALPGLVWSKGDWELWSSVKLCEAECGCRWEYRIHSSMEFNDFLHLLLDWKLAVIDPWSVQSFVSMLCFVCTLLTLSCHMVPFCVHAVRMPMSLNSPISPICSIFQTAHLNCSNFLFHSFSIHLFISVQTFSAKPRFCRVEPSPRVARGPVRQSNRADWKRTDSDRLWNLRANRTRSNRDINRYWHQFEQFIYHLSSLDAISFQIMCFQLSIQIDTN
jgi:hypothetical protein